MARPSKKPQDKRDQRFKMRVSAAERIAIHERAERAGMTLSEYARQMLLSGKVIIEQSQAMPFELVQELNKIGVNLNQMTRVANAKGNLPPALPQTLARINELLDQIR